MGKRSRTEGAKGATQEQQQSRKRKPQAELTAEREDAAASISAASNTSESSEDKESDSASGTSGSQGPVQVDFDFDDPAEADFHIVKSLCQRYLDDRDFDSSSFADILIDQVELSVAMRSDDNCVGVAAILPLKVFSSAQSVRQALAHWQKHADNDCAAQLQHLRKQQNAALLCSERVHNAPPEVSAPLLAILLRDLAAAQGCDDADVSQHAAFEHLLVCAKAYEDTGQDVASTGAVPVSSKDKTAHKGSKAKEPSPKPQCASAAAELVFLKAEEEYLHKHAKWSCSWRTPQDGSFEKQVRLRRVLFCVPRKHLQAASKALAKVFNHDLQRHNANA